MTGSPSPEARGSGWVLGLCNGRHDSSAALFDNGRFVVMAEQERFSRKKRAPGEAPRDAIEYCLAFAGISLDDITAVGLGADNAFMRTWLQLTPGEIASTPRLEHPEWIFPAYVARGARIPPIVPVRHHIAHAASAFWPSGFDEAAILVMDNRGEHTSTTLAYGTRDGIRVLEEFGLGQSLGQYYQSAATYAGIWKKNPGFGGVGDVGKMMALAAYGKPSEDVSLRITDQGPAFDGVTWPGDLSRKDIPSVLDRELQKVFTARCFPFHGGQSDDAMAYANFAASAQHALVQAILWFVRRAHGLVQTRNLVMAGGVALNCAANGKVADAKIFDRLYVQPVSHDGGCAIGSGIAVAHSRAPLDMSTLRLDHAYWGPEYSEEDATDALEEVGVRYHRYTEDEMIYQVVNALVENQVVAWYQGRAEIGPRALGARSLLGNPTVRKTFPRMNRIKRRELWRPIAPSVVAEEFSTYFESAHASPFMIVATTVRPEMRHRIPAVVHVDGTARPQAVTKDSNPRFWRLLDAFGCETGVPVLANTSLNREREAIVNTPGDAISMFLDRDIDMLVLGDLVAVKRR